MANHLLRPSCFQNAIRGEGRRNMEAVSVVNGIGDGVKNGQPIGILLTTFAWRHPTHHVGAVIKTPLWKAPAAPVMP